MHQKILKIFFLSALLILANHSFASVDTRSLSNKPKEIYGNNPENIVIRIGNGGAGPTGILRALSEDFLKRKDKNYSIAWHQDVSPNTLKQLKNGAIDIGLVYEKDQIEAAIKEGWATNLTLIFNDHFLIIGPKNNTAKLKLSDTPEIAFKKIFDLGEKNLQKTFLSRDDNSGTNIKERYIWEMAKVKPWEQDNSWYFKFHVFPKDALLKADNESLYTITDWGTWLSNEQNIKNSAIYIKGGDLLVNPCFAVLSKKPKAEVLEFLQYLKSPTAQNLIANFGKEKNQGRALFTPAARKDFE